DCILRRVFASKCVGFVISSSLYIKGLRLFSRVSFFRLDLDEFGEKPRVFLE
ncbi:hypothetical protein GIB67_002774, partial [Kingdonia uniflora]